MINERVREVERRKQQQQPVNKKKTVLEWPPLIELSIRNSWGNIGHRTTANKLKLNKKLKHKILQQQQQQKETTNRC